MDTTQHNPRGYPDRKEEVRYFNPTAPTREQPDQAGKIAQNEHMSMRPDNLRHSNVLPVPLAANATTQILPANPFRRSVKIWNGTSARLYVKEGPQCTTSSYSFWLETGQGYEPETGDCHAGSWSVYSTVAETVMVTEKT